MAKVPTPTAITVTVNGKPWPLVSSLADAGARDRVFTVTTDPGGKTVVQFGDGLHGACPPAGNKIAVTYRSGSGASGNVASVTIAGTMIRLTTDHALWVAIRNRMRGLSFEFRKRQKPRLRKT